MTITSSSGSRTTAVASAFVVFAVAAVVKFAGSADGPQHFSSTSLDLLDDDIQVALQMSRPSISSRSMSTAAVATIGREDNSPSEGKSITETASAARFVAMKVRELVNSATTQEFVLYRVDKASTGLSIWTIVLVSAGILVICIAVVAFISPLFEQVREIAITMMLAVVYMAWSAGLIATNKQVSSVFPHAFSLAALQMLTCTVASRVLLYASPQRFPALVILQSWEADKQYPIILTLCVIAACFGFGIALENNAYLYASVAFLQIMKEMGLAFVAGFTIFLKLDRIGWQRGLLLLGIVAGGVCFAEGDCSFMVAGLVFQLSSNLLNATRMVLQNFLLAARQGLPLDPMSYVALVCPACLLVLLPAMICDITVDPVQWRGSIYASWHWILTSCLLSFCLNLLVAVLIQRISAVGFCITGSMKNIFVVLGSLVARAEMPNLSQVVGCCLIFAFVPAYSLLKMWESAKPTEAQKADAVVSTPPPGAEADAAATPSTPPPAFAGALLRLCAKLIVPAK
eukprot:gnl/TRDRNA2_/TRDRNA2_36555_c0_seq1.p1 gnl/TRDRNA2_/TRDRNA2_36555_c0~~gnl/TRDRNA2_/TRDRNA2_36555_c0_seq1.p1  ORF type:complete len:515 (+),score=97.31 gnl/TRDRNA2_/TRDRNA2_36555_c0_seq1:102-1646(+)